MQNRPNCEELEIFVDSHEYLDEEVTASAYNVNTIAKRREKCQTTNFLNVVGFCLWIIMLMYRSYSDVFKTISREDSIMQENTALRKYDDIENLFTITSPDDWLVDVSGQAGCRVSFLCPNEVNGFSANVNVVVDHLPPLTDQEFVLFCRLQIKQASGRAQLPVDEVSPTRPDAHVFEWTNRQTPMELHLRQQLFFSRSKAFVVTATALLSNFEEYRGVFKQVLDSFQVSTRDLPETT